MQFFVIVTKFFDLPTKNSKMRWISQTSTKLNAKWILNFFVNQNQMLQKILEETARLRQLWKTFKFVWVFPIEIVFFSAASGYSFFSVWFLFVFCRASLKYVSLLILRFFSFAEKAIVIRNR